MRVNVEKVVAGLDLGSTAIKLAFYDGERFGFWHGPVGLTRKVTEITCHAKSAAYLCPEVRTVAETMNR